MIEFECRNVYNEWLIVAKGGIPDAVTWTVRDERGQEAEYYVPLEDLVGLYECSLHEITTAEHPMMESEWFKLTQYGEQVHLRVGTIVFETTYDELRQALEPFLTEVFIRLDGISNPARMEEVFEWTDSKWPLLTDFEEIYADLSRSED
ncbi:hypothetical protein [Haladaptatus sp. CMSO5]|uniref:hypothetical protein n=1 Tax=Haladaptatus sp. CMSO5 TaxID=3120514 RepID=UPI002FCE3AA4